MKPELPSRRLVSTAAEPAAVPSPERCRARSGRTPGPADRRRGGPVGAAISRHRHLGDDGTARLDHFRNAPGGEDFRSRFANAQLDPLRALDYSRPRDGGRAREAAAAARAGISGRKRARARLARASRGRRPRLARRVVPMACRRLGALAKGMGAGAGLERPPGQPGGGLRHPDRRARYAGSALSPFTRNCEN